MKIKKYSIIFLMDASGSMRNMGDEPWQGLNKFINKQKECKVNFNFTLIFFNSEITFMYKNLEFDKIPDLTKKDYNPIDTTSLYDAIGKGIEYQKTQSMDNVIFVILTDGLDNSSREYDKTGIKNMIKHLESKNKWQFIYLGTNQDAFHVGYDIGINTSCNYSYTPEGLKGIMRSVGNSISRQISGETDEIKLEEINLEEGKEEIQKIPFSSKSNTFEHKKLRSLRNPSSFKHI